MIDLGPHAVFIICSYLGVFIAVAALVAWTLYDARAASKKLAELEAGRPAR